jgi:hypothetical protein
VERMGGLDVTGTAGSCMSTVRNGSNGTHSTAMSPVRPGRPGPPAPHPPPPAASHQGRGRKERERVEKRSVWSPLFFSNLDYFVVTLGVPDIQEAGFWVKWWGGMGL